MPKPLPTIYHEQYGTITRPQLAAYRKFNVSPADHHNLEDAFGTKAHREITEFVKARSTSGQFTATWREISAAGSEAGVPA